MKKLIFILFLFTCIKASAQIPIRSLTNVADKSLYVDNHFTPPRYNDTTQANLNLGLDSCGAIIFTRIDQKIWKRVCNPTKHWEEIGSGSGGSGSVEYVKPGRYTLVDSVGRNYTINVDTAGLFTIIRQEIHDSISGINLDDTVYAKQPLYVDAGVKDTLKFNAGSSGLVKNTFISDGNLYQVVNGDTSLVGSVGGSAGWNLTGNAGTTSSNFIGTTDSEPVRFRVNNLPYGFLDYNQNIVFGSDALISKTTGSSNISLGFTSLYNNKIGSNNIAIGGETDFTDSSGDFNISIGYSSRSGATGSDNVAIGNASLWGGVGNNNLALGSHAGENLVNTNNIIIMNTIPRNNDTTDSPVYISQDLDVSKQRLKFNGQVQIPLGGGDGKVFTSDATGIGSWQDAPNYYGNFFKEKNFADLSKFDVNGATVSASGGNLNFSAGANTYTQSLDIKGNSALENFTITGRFKVGDKTSTSYGFGLGIRTTGVYAMYAFFNMTNGANSGKITLDNVVGLTTSTGLAFSVGDTIIFSLEKTRANVIVQAYNQTTKADPLRLTYNYTIYAPSASLSWYGKYAIFSKGGQFSCDSLSVFSKDIKNPDLLILGDSKTCGYQASNYSDGYAQMIQAKYKNTDIYAAPGFQLQNALSTTNQIISLNPKAVLMALGSNDIRSGRTFAQYTADYDTIVNRFIAAGIQVYHALPFYEKSVNVKPLVDYVIATYPADKIIDTYNPMLATGALDADTLHPSPAGHQAIYKAILNSNIIPGKKTFELPLSAGAVAYGSFDGGLSNDDNFNYIRSGQTGMVRIGSKVRIGTHNGNGIISLSGNNIDQSNGVSFSQVGNDIYIIRDGTLNIKTVAGSVTTSINNVGAFQTGSTATANGGMVVPTMVGYFWGNTSSGYSIASWTGSSGHMDFRVNNVTAATIDSAGRVGVGITTPEESAKLHIFSTTQGVLFPALTQAQRDAIVNIADGLMIYNRDMGRLNWYDGGRGEWMYNTIVEIGAGAPTSTPVCVGDHYIDKIGLKEYVATGNSSSSDWTILN